MTDEGHAKVNAVSYHPINIMHTSDGNRTGPRDLEGPVVLWSQD